MFLRCEDGSATILVFNDRGCLLSPAMSRWEGGSFVSLYFASLRSFLLELNWTIYKNKMLRGFEEVWTLVLSLIPLRVYACNEFCNYLAFQPTNRGSYSSFVVCSLYFFFLHYWLLPDLSRLSCLRVFFHWDESLTLKQRSLLYYEKEILVYGS